MLFKIKSKPWLIIKNYILRYMRVGGQAVALHAEENDQQGILREVTHGQL